MAGKIMKRHYIKHDCMKYLEDVPDYRDLFVCVFCKKKFKVTKPSDD